MNVPEKNKYEHLFKYGTACKERFKINHNFIIIKFLLKL